VSAGTDACASIPGHVSAGSCSGSLAAISLSQGLAP
jgi:hypothetical protein